MAERVESEPLEVAAPARDRRPSAPAMIVLLLAVVFGSVAVTHWWDSRPDRAGAVDVGFFDDMTTHHNQAIQIATAYQRNGTNTVMDAIAGEVVLAQAGDIRQMQWALQDWNRRDDPELAMRWMSMPVPQHAQPGMASDAQLAALKAARGERLDDLFSALMINHHAGGIHMADYAAEHASTAYARRLATIMARNQRLEIVDLNYQRVRLGLPEHEPGAAVAV